MECFAGRYSAALAVVPFGRRRAFCEQKRHHHHHHHHQNSYQCWDGRRVQLQVVNSGGREDSCTAVKEEFADEEDYIKAGGTQLLFVKMQERKNMEKQGKITDKVYWVFSVLFCSLFCALIT